MDTSVDSSKPPANEPAAESPPSHGQLAPWELGDLPEPLPFSAANAFRTIGPGAILLVGAIGMGEWIAGPLLTVRHGREILWIATAAFVLQSLLNLEALRYTLCTGEPITTGLMRLRPGPRVWGPFYALLAVVQLGLPAGAAASAGAVFALFLGRAPGLTDGVEVRWITVGVVVVVCLILLAGRKVERLLEKMSWAMILFIFAVLLVSNVVFVPGAEWIKTGAGFFRIGAVPAGMDYMLLAVFAALAGAGGVGNLALSSWARDKGMGMAAGRAGAETGAVFRPTAENLGRWRTWWRYALIDQAGLWALGCLVGMFLTVNLAAALFTPGLKVSGVAAGVFQAEQMRQVWEGFWLLALVNGFWILFSTALTNADILTRLLADIGGIASGPARRMSPKRRYTVMLLATSAFAVGGAFVGDAGILLAILGATATPIMAISALQIWRVNTTMLPREIRPPAWRQLGLLACAAFYSAVSAGIIAQFFR